MPLLLRTSPHLTPLLDALASELRRAPLPPREMETIVVQSQGMRRWLTLQLADAFGCAASLSLPFPASFVRELGARITGDRLGRDERDPFSREALVWRIDALLRALPPGDAIFQPLTRYLRDGDERRRFGLATQVAARFDDYQMFRADVLDAWERGEDTPSGRHTPWQGALWRQLIAGATVDGVPAPHLATRLRRTIAALHDAPSAGLPQRVSVFGVSALPPLFIDLLVALARHVPVTVYSASLSPSSSHPIAESLGAQSREFVGQLLRLGASHEELPSTRAPRATLLRALQRELESGVTPAAPLDAASGDASLRIIDAHGAQRQLEVVRDELLAALGDDPTLRPHDLLLLVPDAAEWAPVVDAVFGTTAEDVPRIPYRIADRPLRRTQPAAEAMARMLALEGGRLERSEVLGFLSHPLVRQGAGLSDGEVELVEALLQRANVRWGYDAQSRATLGLPAYEDATWRAGLDRLLLGVAAGRRDDVVLNLLPEAGDTAGDPDVVAAFADWIDDLAATLETWRTPRTLGEWSESITAAVERFLVADGGDEQQQVYALLATVRRLDVASSVTGYAEQVPFGVVRDWLERQLDDDGFGGGFLVGGMTVAALKPMRSLPFRVIAVVGLDDGVFPRRERRAAFDLLEQERRIGDRDLRSDDRQLFLDVLLAAGDRLLLSYSGRAGSDNSPRAPSVVLEELLDHLVRRTGASTRASLVVSHPLQPFSEGYFDPDRDPRLFTFSRAQAMAARAAATRGGGVDAPFIAPGGRVSLSSPDARFDLSLRDLTDCWTNPSQFFCRRTLRLSLVGDDGVLSDDEIFAPDHIEQGGIRARMLGQALSGERDVEREQRRLLADGALPPHELGATWHEKLSAEVSLVLEQVPGAVGAHAVPFVLDGDGWRLTGRLAGVNGDTRYAVRAGNIRAEHWIRAWVEHVAMCAARASGIAELPTSTLLVWRAGKSVKQETMPRVDDAIGVLDGLVRAARAGLEAPLPFFAAAGWAWLNAMHPKPKKRAKPKKGGGEASLAPEVGDPDEARYRAAVAYAEEPSFGSRGGDCQDAYVALCFRGVDPMVERGADFERLAATLFAGWHWNRGGE